MVESYFQELPLSKGDIMQMEKIITYKEDHKQLWVPVKRAEPKPVKSSDDLNVAHGLELGKHQSAECVVSGTETISADGIGSLQKDVRTEEDVSCMQPKHIGSEQFENEINSEVKLQNGGDSAFVMSSSTSQNVDSAVTRSSIRGISTRTYMSLSPMTFEYSSSTSIQREDTTSGESQKIGASSLSGQRRVFSAKDSVFASRATVFKYRPGNFGGSKIMSVVTGAKPGPQWCPNRLIHTQKRCLQRLQTSETREEIAKKKSNKWFNKHRPVVPPKMTWKKKCIVTEENINADDMVADGISENTRDAPSDMDIDKCG
jgi:hypothetical protein